MRRYADLTGLPAKRLVSWIGVAKSKFHDWRRRYGKVNEHNALVPRDHWLELWEIQAIVRFYLAHATDGYRRITFMMLDLDIVAVSPATTWRVLSRAGLLKRWNSEPSKKGQGFTQPLAAHEHWHVDIAYINIRCTFYFLISVLDGYSRSIVHLPSRGWDIREQMTEGDVEIVLQRAHEKFPEERPRIISDNGPQFIAKDFKEFIRLRGMTHVKTAPYYPQSNGKIERFHQTIKGECIRQKTPLSLKEAKRIAGAYVEDYNTRRLHSAIGYITPKDKLEGREEEIFKERDRRLEAAREQRRLRRRQTRQGLVPQNPEPQPLRLTIGQHPDIFSSAGETEASSAGEQLARDNRSGFRRKIKPGAEQTLRSQPELDISEISPMPEKTQKKLLTKSNNPKVQFTLS